MRSAKIWAFCRGALFAALYLQVLAVPVSVTRHLAMDLLPGLDPSICSVAGKSSDSPSPAPHEPVHCSDCCLSGACRGDMPLGLAATGPGLTPPASDSGAPIPRDAGPSWHEGIQTAYGARAPPISA